MPETTEVGDGDAGAGGAVANVCGVVLLGVRLLWSPGADALTGCVAGWVGVLAWRMHGGGDFFGVGVGHGVVSAGGGCTGAELRGEEAGGTSSSASVGAGEVGEKGTRAMPSGSRAVGLLTTAEGVGEAGAGS